MLQGGYRNGFKNCKMQILHNIEALKMAKTRQGYQKTIAMSLRVGQEEEKKSNTFGFIKSFLGVQSVNDKFKDMIQPTKK